LYPPDFTEFFEEAVVRTDSISIAVSSTPSGAQVLLNGEVIGNTPVVREVERFGLVEVTVRKRGYIVQSYSRVVMPGDKLRFDVNLDIDEVAMVERAIQGGDLNSSRSSLEKLIDRTETRGAVLAVLKGEGKPDKLDILFVGNGGGDKEKVSSEFRNIRVEGEVFNFDNASPLLSDVAFRESFPEAVLLLGEDVKKLGGNKMMGKWWIWTIIGLGAAGLVYGLTKGGGRDSGGTVTVQF
jgi:hypothetical protein